MRSRGEGCGELSLLPFIFRKRWRRFERGGGKKRRAHEGNPTLSPRVEAAAHPRLLLFFGCERRLESRQNETTVQRSTTLDNARQLKTTQDNAKQKQTRKQKQSNTTAKSGQQHKQKQRKNISKSKEIISSATLTKHWRKAKGKPKES